MKRLEYLSGFSIGHILIKVLDVISKGEFTVIDDYLHKNYIQLWQIFYADEEFVKGLRLGLHMKRIPELIQDFEEWLERLLEQVGS